MNQQTNDWRADDHHDLACKVDNAHQIFRAEEVLAVICQHRSSNGLVKCQCKEEQKGNDEVFIFKQHDDSCFQRKLFSLGFINDLNTFFCKEEAPQQKRAACNAVNGSCLNPSLLTAAKQRDKRKKA